MIDSDRVRIPSPLDVRVDAYKDWLHVNLFDPASDSIGLFNMSLHGDPGSPNALASAAVVWAPMDSRVRATVEVSRLDRASVSPTGLGLDGRLAIHLDPTDHAVTVEAVLPDESPVAFECRPIAPVIAAETPAPFGSGWIAWRAFPRMSVNGARGAGVDVRDLNSAVAYHDHNWGRWHWGDDAGWEWAALLAWDGTSLILSRTTDRAHRSGSHVMHVVKGPTIRRFAGPAVRWKAHGNFPGRPRRVPGAMAALHSGRMAPALPASIRMQADDGVDRIEAEFTPKHACQLITADPVVPGHGFIHELLGTFDFEGSVDGVAVGGHGLGVVEHVD